MMDSCCGRMADRVAILARLRDTLAAGSTRGPLATLVVMMK